LAKTLVYDKQVDKVEEKYNNLSLMERFFGVWI